MSTSFEFPVYRKYPNNKHFFKVISLTEFEELSIMGDYYSIHQKIATILPDRNLVIDMLNFENGPWQLSDEGEYLQVKQICEEKLKKFGQ